MNLTDSGAMLKLALGASLFAVCCFSVNAQQYRWVDDKGRVQYTDTLPPAGAKDIQKKNLNTGRGTAAQPYALQVALKNAPVKLYSTPDCGPACESARNLLNQRGVPFTEISVADPAQLDEVKAVSGATMVPVLLVGRSVQKGFHEAGLHSALDTAGYPPAGILRARNQAAPVPKPAAEPPAAAASPAAPGVPQPGPR